MTDADARTFLGWMKRGAGARATKDEVKAWAAVMDAKHEADDHGSVKAFCEKFLEKPKQGELM